MYFIPWTSLHAYLLFIITIAYLNYMLKIGICVCKPHTVTQVHTGTAVHNCMGSVSTWTWKDNEQEMAYILVCDSVEIWRAYCAVPQNMPLFLRLWTYPCSMKTSFIVHVFSPTCTEQSKNQNNIVSVPCLLISSWPCTEHRVLKIGAASCWEVWSIETWWLMIIWSYPLWLCVKSANTEMSSQKIWSQQRKPQISHKFKLQ
jgi:hypothetical protein